MFSFRCRSCEKVHEGMPTFGWDYPLHYLEVPEADRARRCVLTSDTCTIDNEHFFIRGCLEIPVVGSNEPLSWGAWTTLSATNFEHFCDLLEVAKRSDHGPFFGWLSSAIPTYPNTLNLKTMVNLRNDGIRPYLELEPTQHPLAIEQQQGITLDRVRDIYEAVVHGRAG